jgi:hypothetical protein
MVRHFVILAVGTVALGCAPRTPESKPAAAPQTACNGQREVVVDNNWSQTVDVLGYVNGSVRQQHIGSVNAGHTDRFPLPAAVQSAIVQPIGGLRAGWKPELVSIRYSCE